MPAKKAYELAGLPASPNTAGDVDFYFDTPLAGLQALFPDDQLIVITDENIAQQQAQLLAGFRLIRIAPGEQYKNQQSVDYIIRELIDMEADRNTLLIGVGGGVVTDITGYVASVYMRGIRFGLVPTSILAMVDAAIGGKNGVDVGLYKNMTGTIRQPLFILYDYRFLSSLPAEEWVNGFAEVIKHACIKDAILFSMLERYTLHDYQQDSTLLAELIERNAAIKNSVVISDPFENGDRKLLNFGHTIGHAIENLHGLPHGHAVSIGMVAACGLSEKWAGLPFAEAARVIKLLSHYHLPVDIETQYEKVFEILKMDKKRTRSAVHFILLKKIGEAFIRETPLDALHQQLNHIL